MQQPSHPPAHPLSRPLPPDVAAGESAFIHFYQRFTVFSWAWAWRRTLLFGGIGVLAGASFGASHGLFAHDVGEGIAVGVACSAANLMLVGAGPLLAAFFRHRHWSPHLQRAAILLAVVAGVLLGAWTGELASNYHDVLMGREGSDTKASIEGSMDVHTLVRRLLSLSRDILILFVASGGLALPVYFSEKRRWADHWRRVELEKVAQQHSESEAKLTLLQAQVEPHFLFNTLASVRSLISTDPERASRTIDALAHHLRATLPRLRAGMGARQSTLGEQFDICASYLDLMKVRLGERLHVELSLPAELRDVSFPPLLLISLVENSIKHGAERKPAPTRVVLVARALSGDGTPRLEVSVEDDGAGLTLGMGEGTGLANVRAQLLTRFGAAASFELSQRASGGVRAVVAIPLEPARP